MPLHIEDVRSAQVEQGLICPPFLRLPEFRRAGCAYAVLGPSCVVKMVQIAIPKTEDITLTRLRMIACLIGLALTGGHVHEFRKLDHQSCRSRL